MLYKNPQIQEAQIQQAQRTSSRIKANNNNNKIIYLHISQTTESKRQMTFKLEKKTSPTTGATVRITLNFSKTMQARKEWSKYLKLREKTTNLEFSTP